MHDLLRVAVDHVGVRAVLVAHQHLDLGADRFAIELERLIAATVEEKIRDDLHRGASLGLGDGRHWALDMAVSRTPQSAA
jgi:hypothetical protein